VPHLEDGEEEDEEREDQVEVFAEEGDDVHGPVERREGRVHRLASQGADRDTSEGEVSADLGESRQKWSWDQSSIGLLACVMWMLMGAHLFIQEPVSTPDSKHRVKKL
jgi:hypothetical protein